MTTKKHKVITICGSSRFIDIIAVVGWLLEKEENTIVLSIRSVPFWYIERMYHQTKYKKVADQLDKLHLKKIDISDEIFVVDIEIDGQPYIGESTSKEIKHAESMGKNIRYYSKEDFGRCRIDTMAGGLK